MELQKKFSTWNLLIFSINGMIGSAWLFAPFYAAKIAGIYSLLAWVLAGIGTMIIAFTFAELSAMLPFAGGTAALPNFTHGTLAGFIFGWVAWISALTMAPIEVQAVIQYSANYFPSLIITTHDVVHLSFSGFLAAIVLMAFLCLLNILSFQGLFGANFILFSFKVGVIALTIVTFSLISNHTSTTFIQQSHFQWHTILSSIAVGGVAFAFTGFKHGVELAAETKHPQTALPIAIMGSIGICLLIYLCLQWAFFKALPESAILHGFSQLHFQGDIGPFAGLAATAGFLWLAKLLYADALVSPLGAGLVYMTSTSRILFALSKMGCLPQKLQKINRDGFPWISIIVNFILGLLLFLPFPGWQAMVGFLVSGMILSYAIAPIALLTLRKQFPYAERPFFLKGAQFFAPLAFYCCNLLVYWTGFDNLIRLTALIIISLLIYFFSILRKKISLEKKDLATLIWFIPYLAGLNFISYAGTFSGKGILPLGLDLICLAIFSLFILFIAVHVSTKGAVVSSQINLQEMVLSSAERT